MCIGWHIDRLSIDIQSKRNERGWRITYTSVTDSLSFWLVLWQLTDIPPTIDRYSAGNQWSTYRLSVGRYIDRDICQWLVDMSADISVDASVDMSTNISQSWYRPSVERYVDWHIRRHSAHMSTDISVECQSICRPIYRSRGAQNTHDPDFSICRYFSTICKRVLTNSVLGKWTKYTFYINYTWGENILKKLMLQEKM